MAHSLELNLSVRSALVLSTSCDPITRPRTGWPRFGLGNLCGKREAREIRNSSCVWEPSDSDKPIRL